MSATARTLLAVEKEAQRRRREELIRVLGTTIGDALGDPNVVEVMVNEDGVIWIDQLRGGMRDTELRMAPIEVEDVVTTIASALGKAIDRRNPSLQGELPLDGSRVQAFVPPATENAPVLVIRKKASRIFTLGDYVAMGMLTPGHRRFLETSVRERRVLLVVGGTGSGKTTFVNALLAVTAQEAPDDRLVIIEDTRELECPSRNKVHLLKSETRSYTQLLKESLRARPDRLVFGELRDEAAFDFLMALNTGHRGSFSTIHANSARDALARLEDLVRVAGYSVVPSTVARAIDALIYIERAGDTRRITEIASVRGLSADGDYQLEYLEPDA
jgi:type IV secretion system protein VirB11